MPERRLIELSDRQFEVMESIVKYTRSRGRPPTQPELAKRVKLSMSRTREHLRILMKKGWIVVEPGVVRGIVILDRRMRPLQ